MLRDSHREKVFAEELHDIFSLKNQEVADNGRDKLF